jgi:hypothetical protein
VQPERPKITSAALPIAKTAIAHAQMYASFFACSFFTINLANEKHKSAMPANAASRIADRPKKAALSAGQYRDVKSRTTAL